MNSVAEITENILLTDNAHQEALRQGTLNLRSYASLIHKQVEILCKKEVKTGTIVIALSRLRENLQKIPSLKPEVIIENLTIKAGLSVLTYEKTNQTLVKLSNLIPTQRKEQEFFVISEGMVEVTLVGSTGNINQIEKGMEIPSKSKFNNAVALIIRFDEKYVEIPNVLYNFVSNLAIKRINLLQVVSNLTEVSFIINKGYLNDAMDVFKTYLQT
jgi:hypothetical protein